MRGCLLRQQVEEPSKIKVRSKDADEQRKQVVTMFEALKIGAPNAVIVANPRLDIDDCAKHDMFNTLKYGFNRRFVSDVNWVLVCRTVQDVVNAVQLCVKFQMRPTVGSGYHCYEDFVVKNPTGMLIDVSMMDTISTTTHLATDDTMVIIEPGNYIWNTTLHLFKVFGKLLPGGSCYSVCAGGHICGGGYGINSRKFGLTVDYVYGVEMVTVDEEGNAKATTVTMDTIDEKGQDLLFSCRGGGGQQFGIITKYYFKLKELPSAPMDDVYLIVISVAWYIEGKLISYKQFKAVIDAYGGFWADQGLKNYYDLHTFMHTSHCNFNGFTITCQALEWESLKAFIDHMDAALAAAALPPESNPSAAYGLWQTHVRAALPVETFPDDSKYIGKSGHAYNILKFPWLTSTQFLNGSPQNSRFKNAGSYHTKPFTEHMAQTTYKYLTMPKADMTYTPFRGGENQTFSTVGAEIQIVSYGGKINELGVDESGKDITAVAHRSSIMTCQFQVYWNNEMDDDINLWWISNFMSEMYQYCPMQGWKPEFRQGEPQNPNLLATYNGAPTPNRDQGTDGSYINYPDLCLGTLQQSYAPLYWPKYETYARLQKTKKEWDPSNRFNFGQSISRSDSSDALGPDLARDCFEPSTRTGPL